MRILVLSLYYDPDICQSNGPIIRAICDDLAAAGHDVTVLTSFPHYNQDSIWPEYRGRLFQKGRIGWVTVRRSYIYVSAGRSALARILNYLSFNVSSTLSGVAAGKHDVIFAMSPPLTIGVTAWLLGKLYGIPYCYNLQDIWPDVAVKLGMLRGRRTIAFFERMERFIYRKATKIFAISDEFRDNVVAKGVDPSKVAVIPNFVDTDRVRPMDRLNAFSQQMELDDRFVVLYAGNIGLSQGLEVILDAAEHLRHDDDILFLVVGSGGKRQELMRDSERRGLLNVKFLPLQPEDDVPLLYASADIALIPLRKGITENSVPSKTYTIMAAARPYIAGVDEGSNVWRLTGAARCGICIPPEDGKSLSQAIIALRADGRAARAMGTRGREYVERHFARQAVTARYRTSLEMLHRRSPPLPPGRTGVETAGERSLPDG